jgi:hypothetical protein
VQRNICCISKTTCADGEDQKLLSNATHGHVRFGCKSRYCPQTPTHIFAEEVQRLDSSDSEMMHFSSQTASPRTHITCDVFEMQSYVALLLLKGLNANRMTSLTLVNQHALDNSSISSSTTGTGCLCLIVSEFNYR